MIEKAKEKNGYKTISMRIPAEALERLDLLAKETNHSRSALISKFIEYSLDNCKIKNTPE